MVVTTLDSSLLEAHPGHKKLAAAALETEPGMRDANLHNTTLWEDRDGTPYLSFPANDEGRVFTTTLVGTLVERWRAWCVTEFQPDRALSLLN